MVDAIPASVDAQLTKLASAGIPYRPYHSTHLQQDPSYIIGNYLSFVTYALHQNSGKYPSMINDKLSNRYSDTVYCKYFKLISVYV